MKTKTSGWFKAWTEGVRWKIPVMLVAIGLVGVNAFALPTVTTLADANHGKSGYKDGNTFSAAQFNVPAGIALDPSGKNLFLADSNNNAVRMISTVGDRANSYTYSVYTNKQGISHPVAVAIDSSTNLYVLNYGNGKNGTILKFNAGYYLDYGLRTLIATNAVNLTNATSLALDYANNIYVTIKSNTVIRVGSSGTNEVVGVITNTGTSLRGVVVMTGGKLALTDAGNNGIWIMDPANTNVLANAVKLTGFNGAGDVLGPPFAAAFNRPENIAKAGNNILVVSDFNNHKVKLIDAAGNVTRLYGVKSTYWNATYKGWQDGTVMADESIDPVEARQPYGLAIAYDGTVFVTETYYHLLRMATGTGLPALPPPPPPAPTIWSVSVKTNYAQVTLTWSPVTGVTNYNVKRSTESGKSYSTVGSTGDTSFTDTSVMEGTTYYYVVSSVNAGGEGPNSQEVAIYVPLLPVPDPEIGFITFPADTSPMYRSVFNEFSSMVLNNDAYIVIKGSPQSSVLYSLGATPSTTNDTIPYPNGSTTPGYTDGLDESEVAEFALKPETLLPDTTIKAVGVGETNRPRSAVVSARVQFIVGNPVIAGNNAAAFTVSDITEGAHLYVTYDGTEPSPTNGIDKGTLASVTNVWEFSFAPQSNTLFQARAYKSKYQPSAIVSNLFTVSAFKPNTISFGRATGEPYSRFVARPGQNFWAPVTLSLVEGFGKMYSLQFNVSVIGGYSNILNSNAIPPVVVNSTNTDFFSMLMTAVKPIEGKFYPPADGQWYLDIPPVLVYSDGTTNFIPSQFVNPTNNLLSVGWFFRTGFKYGPFYDDDGIAFLDFDTTAQDLIAFSIVHDTLFKKSDGLVVVGAYSFQVPSNATNGDQYFMQLGSASATSDGVGAPGSSIFLAPPASSQAVTVGSPSYVVGDAAPFHWLNAGDFGDATLDNSDVMQVYQAAIPYPPVNVPPTNSDLYAAMDSSGGYGAWDSANGYYTNLGPASLVEQQAMWDGNDLSINTNAFGDKVLDVNDVYVTFRRSTDPSLTWFKRFWTNGQEVAVTTPSLASNSNSPNVVVRSSVAPKALTSTGSQQPFVTFSAGDAVVSSGQTVQIPIYAQINGDYHLKVLGLNLTVVPLDGSPALTQAITFTPSAALGNPTLPPLVKGYDSYSAVWLNSAITGLTGNALVGTLTLTVPTTATSASAYAVHFNRASGSPNGLVLFPKQAVTGLVTLSSRTNSSFGDGIPDSWRLRWFGTVNNFLSLSNACPSGDGVNNWNKYVAGVDPSQAGNFPSVNPKSSVPAGYSAAIYWPSVSGKKYAIERSSTLFPGDWSIIATNTGTGGNMEYNDPTPGSVKFYRVRIVP